MVTLADEVRYFHRQFFPGEIDPEVADRYVAANRACLSDIYCHDTLLVETVVASRLDVEAIELVLRQRGRKNVLTNKLQILFFLLEVRARYYAYFVNQSPIRARVVLSLVGSMLRTSYKFIKGKYLIWRYRLV